MLRIYRCLLWMCPAPLRREYGAAMEETLARRLTDARREGSLSYARVCRRELAGVVALAASERWHAYARRRWHLPAPEAARKAGYMDGVMQELRHAARRLGRSPGFSLAAVLTLALAIGANCAIFAVVHRVLLNPLPYGDPGRLIALDYGVPRQNVASGLAAMSWQLYYQFVDHARTIEGTAVYDVVETTLTGQGDPERIRISHATPSLAHVLRVGPAVGRWFTEAEGEPGGRSVVVLSHAFWARRYAADPGVLGRTLVLDGVAADVVGVMPASFAFPETGVQLWVPARSTRASASFLFLVSGVARLRDGVKLESARSELTSLIADLARVSPNQYGIVSTAIPLREAMVGRVADMLWILLASVGLVLLIACANVANLFLVRSEARQREVAVRRALGAGGAGIARYFLAESTLLSLTGAALGLALASGAIRALVLFGPNLPRIEEVRPDGTVIAFTLTLSVLAAIALAAIPLLRLGPLAVSLHENGRDNTATRRRHRARHVLMAAQVAVALVLLVSSGLMVRSFQKLRDIDPGFDSKAGLTFRIGLPDREYPNRRAAAALHQSAIDRLSALPGVAAVSASTCLPLAGRCWGNSFVIEGRVRQPGGSPLIGSWRAVAGGYFEAMGIPVLRGRAIDRGAVDRGEPILVVNQAFARTTFPNEDPIGKRIRSSVPPNSPLGMPPWLTIVGIVGNTPTNALGEPAPLMQLYMPMSIAGGPEIPINALVGPSVSAMSYVVRSAAPADLAGQVRSTLAAIDGNLAVAQVRTLSEILDRAAAQTAFTMVLLTIAAAVALLLGVIGIYGVMSYVVSQRTSEIGVRLALGAEPRGVTRMIVRQGGLVTLVGVAAGLAAAFAGSRVMASLLYGVSPRDPAVFAATTLALSILALIACWVPARRAARLSPLDALRTE